MTEPLPKVWESPPSWGARARAIGHLLLWLGEIGVQGFQLVGFLGARRRTRARFRALIVDRPRADSDRGAPDLRHPG